MKIEEELKSSQFRDENQKATLNVLFTAAWLYNRISADLKKYGLYHEQYNVLRILRGQKNSPVCQKEILCRMINKSSNLTRILAKLKTKKLINVNVSEADRREYMITISGKGLDLLQEIDKDFNRLPKDFVNLSESEAFHLNALLDKMRGK